MWVRHHRALAPQPSTRCLIISRTCLHLHGSLNSVWHSNALGALPVPPLAEPNWSWMLFNTDRVQVMATLNTAKYNMNSVDQTWSTTHKYIRTYCLSAHSESGVIQFWWESQPIKSQAYASLYNLATLITHHIDLIVRVQHRLRVLIKKIALWHFKRTAPKYGRLSLSLISNNRGQAVLL